MASKYAPEVPGTTYVSPEVAALALAGRCPICGTNRASHRHSLDQGELDEITALERGERTWAYQSWCESEAEESRRHALRQLDEPA
jgi:hypothetical protein